MTDAGNGPSIADVAAAIGAPPERWPSIAREIPARVLEAEIAAGSAVTGRWVGPIAHASPFAEHWTTNGVEHHWIELHDGRVLDPLRWALEADAPYVYLAPSSAHTIDYLVPSAVPVPESR